MEYEIIKISSLNEFNDIISDLTDSWIFRGQDNSEWELIPSIDRLKPNLKNAREHEIKLINEFKRRCLAYLEYEPKDEYEYLAVAQHHGLPTRLLDWTTSPYIALFFALESEFNDTSAVWCYQINNSQEKNTELKNPFTIEEIDIYFPRQISKRISAQNGLFTVHPARWLDSSSNIRPYWKNKLIRIDICGLTAKMKIKRFLHQMGIHRASLFPDLEGLSQFLTSSINVEKERFKIHQNTFPKNIAVKSLTRNYIGYTEDVYMNSENGLIDQYKVRWILDENRESMEEEFSNNSNLIEKCSHRDLIFKFSEEEMNISTVRYLWNVRRIKFLKE